MTDARPIRFIGEPTTVHFEHPPLLEKKPGCPDSFTWRDSTFLITEILGEWHDYRRHGRMAHNMRATHVSVARRRGSWGVGQHYFRVLTESGQIFDLYYDRAPKDASHRKGQWFLFQELALPNHLTPS